MPTIGQFFDVASECLRLPSITIDGRELPMPEGCPDFDTWTGSDLFFLVQGVKKVRWNSLEPWQKRHAACVAHRWFEYLARKEASETCPDGPTKKYKEYKADAETWGALADELWEV